MEQTQQTTPPTRTASSSKFSVKKVVSFVVTVISFALIASFVRACNSERRQLPPAGSVVTVWVPHLAMGRMIPYQNAEVLKARDWLHQVPHERRSNHRTERAISDSNATNKLTMPRLRPKTGKYAPSVQEAIRDAYSALLIARSLTNRHYRKPHELRLRLEEIVSDYSEFQSLVLQDFDSEGKQS